MTRRPYLAEVRAHDYRSFPANSRIGAVSVSTSTLYPFGDTLTTTITSDHDFTYYVRIPTWVTDGTISIAQGSPVALNPSNALQAVSIKSGTTKFTLELPAPITIGKQTRKSEKSVFLIHLSRVSSKQFSRHTSWTAPLCIRYPQK